MEGDVAFGIGTAMLGVATGVVAYLVFAAAITAGIGLIIILILVVIGYLVSLLKHDKLQHWLDSCYFGKHDLNEEGFSSLGDQNAAYTVMVKGA